MRFFFRSRQFKIILSITLCLVALSIMSFLIGGNLSPQSNVFGTIAAPFRTAFTTVSGWTSDFVKMIGDGNEAQIKNAELENELNELRKKLSDYDEAVKQNEFYEDYLEIKDENPDFKFCPATLVARDKNDPYKSFTINKGSLSGLKEYDTVITDAGLVGYITDVGLTTSKVITILSPDITLGALDDRTDDSGVLSGTLELAEEGNTRFYNLSRSCNVAIGDFVVTSGEGIFPSGLLIGTVQSIGSDKYNTSIYASVKPFVDIAEIRSVMVITNFEGKGGLEVGGSK
ncbi:MAG: rod shape-determining protein MreC [Clostridia bacterium]|nr:rod shape-determining protein MreC [Clostridia bacterium]